MCTWTKCNVCTTGALCKVDNYWLTNSSWAQPVALRSQKLSCQNISCNFMSLIIKGTLWCTFIGYYNLFESSFIFYKLFAHLCIGIAAGRMWNAPTAKPPCWWGGVIGLIPLRMQGDAIDTDEYIRFEYPSPEEWCLFFLNNRAGDYGAWNLGSFQVKLTHQGAHSKFRTVYCTRLTFGGLPFNIVDCSPCTAKNPHHLGFWTET